MSACVSLSHGQHPDGRLSGHAGMMAPVALVDLLTPLGNSALVFGYLALAATILADPFTVGWSQFAGPVIIGLAGGLVLATPRRTYRARAWTLVLLVYCGCIGFSLASPGPQPQLSFIFASLLAGLTLGPSSAVMVALLALLRC